MNQITKKILTIIPYPFSFLEEVNVGLTIFGDNCGILKGQIINCSQSVKLSDDPIDSNYHYITPPSSLKYQNDQPYPLNPMTRGRLVIIIIILILILNENHR